MFSFEFFFVSFFSFCYFNERGWGGGGGGRGVRKIYRVISHTYNFVSDIYFKRYLLN